MAMVMIVPISAAIRTPYIRRVVAARRAARLSLLSTSKIVELEPRWSVGRTRVSTGAALPRGVIRGRHHPADGGPRPPDRRGWKDEPVADTGVRVSPAKFRPPSGVRLALVTLGCIGLALWKLTAASAGVVVTPIDIMGRRPRCSAPAAADPGRSSSSHTASPALPAADQSFALTFARNDYVAVTFPLLAV